MMFPALGFALEKAAGLGYLNNSFVICVEIIYLFIMLVYPIVLIQWIGSTAFPATYFMLCAVVYFLKLTSFHHVCYDNRLLISRIAERGKTPDKASVEDLATLFDVNERTMSIAITYPNNLSVRHFMRFLLAPTCCYQFVYPTAPTVRVSYVLWHMFETIFCYCFMWYLMVHHMHPISEGSIIHFQNRDYYGIFMSTLHMAVPASYVWLTVFYSTFHSWLNFLAELTQFADRRFYSDWWNAGNLGEYWRKWNQPIHNYLLRHVYFPLRRAGVGSRLCLFTTFTVSAVFHEYIVAGIFSILNFAAFFLMMANIPCMMFQRQFKNAVSPNTNNTLFWLFYVIFGQPFAMNLVYYQMMTKTSEH